MRPLTQINLRFGGSAQALKWRSIRFCLVLGGAVWLADLGVTAVSQFADYQTIVGGKGLPQDAFPADLDGDGDIDLLLGTHEDDGVVWYENLGGGNFSQSQLISSEVDGCSGVFAADLDGDGDLDILSSSEEDNRIAWYENLGAGAFGPQNVISLNVTGASDVSAGDIDGDGLQDVLVASEDDGAGWFRNLGGGLFSNVVIIDTFGNSTNVHAADLDNDGDQDIVVGIHATASNIAAKVFWNQGGGSAFNQSTLFILTGSSGGTCVVRSVDIDADNDLDLVLAAKLGTGTGDNRISWFENLGTTFAVESIVTGAPLAVGVGVADLDGNGTPDILMGGQNPGWVSNQGMGNFGPKQVIDTSLVGGTIDAVDLDGDGVSDPIVTSPLTSLSNFVGWHRNLGMGAFSARNDLAGMQTPTPRDIATGDLDGDGILDLVVAAYDNDSIAWLKGAGTGLFGQLQTLSSNLDGVSQVSAVDLDSDGDLDVLFAASRSGEIGWHENTGGGLFAAAQVIAHMGASSGASGRAVHTHAEDLNGDGLPDVLCSSSFSNKVQWAPNLGAGTFGSLLNVSNPSLGPKEIKTGDIDGDGDADILVALAWADHVATIENLGNGNFGSATVAAGAGPLDIEDAWGVELADIDGDGDLDAAGIGYGSISWSPNDGQGNFDASDYNGIPKQYSLGEDFELVDLDHDGLVDAVSCSRQSSSGAYSISWAKNMGAGVFAQSVQIANNAENPWAVHTADLDGDGDADVLGASLGDDRVGWSENLTDNPPLIGLPYCQPAETNSTGVSGNLIAVGSSNVADMDVQLRASALPLNQFGFFLNGTDSNFVSFAGGSSGHLCLGGAIGRYNGITEIFSTGALGVGELFLNLADTPGPNGSSQVMAGQTWYFQCWYRDSSILTSNFTNGMTITFR